MSTISQAFNNWLQRQGASVMRQEATVCEAFPPRTRDAMIDISLKSANKDREMGGPITQDYTLGRILTGSRTRVAIPRPAGTIGTYHTHPYGWARPSTYDIVDTISKDDKVMCIGASGKIGTKIQCFIPKEPKWSELRDKLTELSENINDFNRSVGRKYRRRGVDLRKLLSRVGSTDYVSAVQSMTPGEIKDEVETTEREARATGAASRAADRSVAEASRAVEIATAGLDRAVTEEEKKEAELNLRDKRGEAGLAIERARIEHEHMDRAVTAAGEAAIKSEIRARGVTPADTDEADKFIREGAMLERRRQALIDGLDKQLLYMGYEEEWRPQKKVNGWEAEKLMMDSCRIIWEALPEELPMEW